MSHTKKKTRTEKETEQKTVTRWGKKSEMKLIFLFSLYDNNKNKTNKSTLYEKEKRIVIVWMELHKHLFSFVLYPNKTRREKKDDECPVGILAQLNVHS